MDHFPNLHSSEMLWVHASVILTPTCTPRAITMLPPGYHVTFALHSYRQITSTYDSIDGTSRFSTQNLDMEYTTFLSFLYDITVYPPLSTSQLARFLTRCMFLGTQVSLRLYWHRSTQL